MMVENEMKNLMLGGFAVLFMANLLLSWGTNANIESALELSEEDRIKSYLAGFNAGWLDHSDCVSWAVEVGEAQSLSDALYLAEYFCPFEGVQE